MSVLVTGAGGFIGGHLAAYFLAQGRRVRCVDRKPLADWYQVHAAADNVIADLKSPDACMAACKGMDVCYQLAADMGGMGFIENNKALCMLSVLINTNMLLAAREHEIRTFLFSSSACVYNEDKQKSVDAVPLREEDAYPAMPEDGYGWEKLFSERMCRHFREDFGLRTRVARYHNVYGPFGAWEDGREKAPAAICRKVIHAKHTGNLEIEIWGDGTQSRSFMYVDDCVKGTVDIAASDVVHPINLGSAVLTSINELVSAVEAVAGVKLARRYKLDAPKGVDGRNSDNAMIRRELGWEPSIGLEYGLEKTYRWIFDEYMKKHG